MHIETTATWSNIRSIVNGREKENEQGTFAGKLRPRSMRRIHTVSAVIRLN